MNIIIDDYILKPEVNAPERFNLYKIVKGIYAKDIQIGDVTMKKGTESLTEKIVGYGFTLENAVTRIIADKINVINGNIELKTYLNEYRNLKADIFKNLKR